MCSGCSTERSVLTLPKMVFFSFLSEKMEEIMSRFAIEIGNGLGMAFYHITFIQMILYWVDPSLPKIGKLRFKKTIIAVLSLFLCVISIDLIFHTKVWLKSF